MAGSKRVLSISHIVGANQMSCEAATRTKPRARLCEPWVTARKNFRNRGAATELSSGSFRFGAAPKWYFANGLCRCFAARNKLPMFSQGSQSLALGLVLSRCSAARSPFCSEATRLHTNLVQ